MDKVYEPEVMQETPFPMEGITAFTPSTPNAVDTYTPTTAKEKVLPKKRIATELLSTSLNTRSRKILEEFELVQSGGIQVGNFQEGLSGDLRITPNGLTARDLAGITTFAISGTDGSATFKGEVQSGSLITGEVVVGNNRVIIDGTDGTIVINDGSNDRVLIGYQLGGF